MTAKIINVCRGWACPLVTKCGKSEFNLPGELHGWVRWFMSPQVGEHCAEFKPLHEFNWGNGADHALAD